MNVCLTTVLVLVALTAGCEHAVDDDRQVGRADPLDAQAVAVDCAPGSVCPRPALECADLAEQNSYRWTARADDAARSDRVVVTAPLDVVRGARAVRLTTSSGALAFLRYGAPSLQPIDASAAAALELVVRGRNGNVPTWQGNAPVVALVDTAGRRRVLTPDRALLSDDGRWTRVSVPLGGGPSARGEATFAAAGFVELSSLAAIEIGADTWGAGFELDVDGVAFVGASAAASGCAIDCPAGCSGNGACDQDAVTCACPVGAIGSGCEQCTAGFVAADHGGCVLLNDGAFDVWPNEVSRANSDAWLAVHHDEVKALAPKVLVLNFANPSEPAATDALVDDVIAAFAEASRPPAGGEPALR